MCLELNTFSLSPVDPNGQPSEDGLYTGNDTPNKECGSHKTNSFNVLPMHHLSLQTNRSSQLRSRECSNSTTLSLHRRQCHCFVLMWCSAGAGNATQRKPLSGFVGFFLSRCICYVCSVYTGTRTFVMNDKQIQLFVSVNGTTQVIRTHAKDTVKNVLSQLPSLCIAWVEADGKRLSLNHPLAGLQSGLTLFGYTGGLRGGVGEVRCDLTTPLFLFLGNTLTVILSSHVGSCLGTTPARY